MYPAGVFSRGIHPFLPRKGENPNYDIIEQIGSRVRKNFICTGWITQTHWIKRNRVVVLQKLNDVESSLLRGITTPIRGTKSFLCPEKRPRGEWGVDIEGKRAMLGAEPPKTPIAQGQFA
jgi:hypothetical protein